MCPREDTGGRRRTPSLRLVIIRAGQISGGVNDCLDPLEWISGIVKSARTAGSLLPLGKTLSSYPLCGQMHKRPCRFLGLKSHLGLPSSNILPGNWAVSSYFISNRCQSRKRRPRQSYVGPAYITGKVNQHIYRYSWGLGQRTNPTLTRSHSHPQNGLRNSAYWRPRACSSEPSVTRFVSLMRLRPTHGG